MHVQCRRPGRWVLWLVAAGLALGLAGAAAGWSGATRPWRPVAARGAGEARAPQGEARLELLGHHDLGGTGLNADVWLHRGVAYVGTWAANNDRTRGCPGTGVKLVDLTDPTQPALLGTLAQHPGTSAEVIRVRAVDTPAFRGDLLAVGLQNCGSNGRRGLELWDVTDPRAPQALAFFDVGPGTGGVHELDLVQRVDGRVLALLAVPFSEAGHPERLGDLRIVEVTDPRAPRQLAAWGARAALGLGQEDGQGSDPLVYGHSARASADGLRAYVSYWDAGVVILDLTDPAAPRLLGRTTFAAEEEGNAHSADLTPDGRVLIEADEVLDVEQRAVRVDGPPEVAGMIPAGGTLPAPPWPDTQTVTAELAYLGRGCPAGDWTARAGLRGEHIATPDPYPQDPQGHIALLERGGCPFADKVERAQAAGAVGAVIINSAEAPLTPTSDSGPLGAFGIPRGAGERLKAVLARGQPVEVTLAADLRGYQDFGGLRFWDVTNPAQPRLLSRYRTPRAQVDPLQGPAEPGRFSAHNPVVQGELLFVSWFSDGVRVLDIRDPAAPREVAAWIPPPPASPRAVPTYLGPGPLVWGVAVEGDLVVASDINNGLYTLRLVRGSAGEGQ
ncbi:MAG TPA: PA domain-containing protein [Chloroflexota bacterium]|nr:PA domain-containing protein [Chloroflexota bacterium]